MSQEETNCLPDTVISSELRLSKTARALFLFTGTILPIICFLIGFPDQPVWQSGAISNFPRLFLSHKGTFPFYPFLLYNMTCMTLMVYKPGRFAGNVWVRCGIYSGVVVGMVYWFVFMLAFSSEIAKDLTEQIIGFIVFSLLGVFFSWIIIKIFHNATNNACVKGLILVTIAICCIPPVLLFVIISLFFCSTSWAVASYITMTVILLRHQEDKRFRFTLAQLMGMVTWFAGYFAAWRVSYLTVLEEYAKLPTTAPDCYICTAAACGHNRWVGTEERITENGEAFRVNNQMRYFKAFELLILAINPKSHRICRNTYDTIGPPLARFLVNPIFADIAYSILKPAEWLCRGLLYIITRDTSSHLRILYREDQK
jgi:hypothetical protein